MQKNDMNQLTSFARGELNSTKDAITGTPSRTQEWDFDTMGNWSSLTNDGGTPEEREHNLQNEITEIGSNALAYDDNGNLTTDDHGNSLIYDAWNRLVRVQDNEETVLAGYGYDTLTRRITEVHGSDEVQVLYSANWQVLEEQNAEGEAVIQYVWSVVYVDAMVLRDRDTDDNGSLDVRICVQHDANWNVTALIDATGNLMERFVYDAYGQAVVLSGNWFAQSSSAFDWMHLYQGGSFDVDVNLYSFRFRDYSPALGRWLSLDPLGFAAGDTNIYRALSNNPVNRLDPSGLVSGTLNHGYPLYLGGNPYQPLIDLLNQKNHLAFHRYLWDRGFTYGQAGRDQWALLTRRQQRALIEGALRAAGAPRQWIQRNLSKIMAGATPGIKATRVYCSKVLRWGLLGGAAAEVLLNPCTADAAELPRGWRARPDSDTRLGRVEVSTYMVTIEYPDGLNIFGQLFGQPSRIVAASYGRWQYYADMTATDAKQLEGLIDSFDSTNPVFGSSAPFGYYRRTYVYRAVRFNGQR